MGQVSGFFLKLLIELAIQFGLPWLLTKVRLPPELVQIIESLLNSIKGTVPPTPQQKHLAKMNAKHAVDWYVHKCKFPDNDARFKVEAHDQCFRPTPKDPFHKK